jgi:HTH-type transcriptional regulator / antitoxin HigA
MDNLQPIRNRADHQAALTEIERLFDVSQGTPEFDRLEAILYYMESRGLTRQDLEPALGSRSRVAEILNRKRPLTLEMIRRLHAQLGIPAQTLIQTYPLAA